MIHKFDRDGYAAFRLFISQRLIARLFGTSRPFRYLATEDPEQGNFEVLRRFDVSAQDLPTLGRHVFSSKPISKTGVFRVPEALVDAATNFVYDEDGRLIGDAIHVSVADAVISKPARPLKPKRLDYQGDFLYLGVPSGFYHWLVEDFPAYLQARAAVPTAITLIPRRSPRFVTDALVLLNEPFSRMPVSARVSSLVFASKGLAFVPNAIDLETLRDFRDQLTLTDGGVRKIYISRRDAGRTPQNETEIEALMSTRGYELIQLAGLPLHEQISMFRNAHHIVGTHGAGLANIAWCAPNSTKVLEIKLEGQPLCFKWLADLAALEYSAVTNDERDPWLVDLTRLAKALDALE